MDILGIGPLELLFVVIIALIVLGPKDMAKAGRSIGRFLRTIMMSETWQVVRQASNEIRGLPNRLIREAGVDEFKNGIPSMNSLQKDLGLQDIQQDLNDSVSDLSDWTTPPETIAPPDTASTQVQNQPSESGESTPNDQQQQTQKNDTTDQEVGQVPEMIEQDADESATTDQDALISQQGQDEE